MKKQNNRAHKRALNVSRRKSNRNTEAKKIKKMEREMNESFSHQLDLLFTKIDRKIDEVKKSINIRIAKTKFAWKNRRILKNSSTDFHDLVRYFACCESISFCLAALILINFLPSFNTKNAKDAVSNKILDSMEIAYEFIELQKANIEENIKEETNVEVLEELPNIVVEPMDEPILEKELTLDDMIKITEYRYGVSHYEFLYTAAVCLLEAGENQYDGCYDVASVFLNRITCQSTIDFVNTHYAPNSGTNIYAQARCPGQFTVSKAKIAELVNSDMTVYTGFEAVVKCFYTGIPYHNYYRFVAPHLRYNQECVQLHPNGDYFFAEVPESDRLRLEDVLPNFNGVPDSLLEDVLDYEQNEKIMTLAPNKR